MSTLRVDTITDEAGTGPVSFPNGVTGVEPFKYTAVSGATQTLDVGTYNFFDAGTLTADTTVSFSNVPTEAQWTYTANVGIAASFDLEAGSYDSVNFYVGNEEPNNYGVFFKPDGTKMYVIGTTSDTVYQYTLSTAWDVSTASYDSVSFSVSSQDGTPFGIFFKPDGTKMYVVGISNDRVYQYTLSTAWALNTASYDSVSFSVSTQDIIPAGIFFKPDGTKMYMCGQGNDTVYQYTLSTAWAVNTASYDSVSFSVNSQMPVPGAFTFKPDGTKMYVGCASNKFVYEYNLSTAWALNTASYSSNSLYIGDEVLQPRGIFFKPDGTKMYATGPLTDAVWQYSTASPFVVTLPASVQNPPAESVLYDDTIAYTFYTADGGTTVTLIGEEIT